MARNPPERRLERWLSQAQLDPDLFGGEVLKSGGWLVTLRMSTRAGPRRTPAGEERETSCKEWGMIHLMQQPILRITLLLFRCSLTPDTVSVRDRPAHLVSVSGPRGGLISVKLL